MWSSGRDKNEDGESILLLQPKDRKSKHNAKNPSSSHIGGLPVYHEHDPMGNAETPKCSTCQREMILLIQLNAPLDELDRTLYVFGCNRPSCHASSNNGSNAGSDTEDGAGICRFHACFGGVSGGGAIRCFRSQQQWKSSENNTKKESANGEEIKNTTKNTLDDNDWGEDDGSDGWGDNGDDDDDWGASGDSKDKNTNKKDDSHISMDELEAMISKCEMQSESNKPASSKTSSLGKSNPSDAPQFTVSNAMPSFAHYDLEMINEPPSTSRSNGLDDDDDDDDYDESSSNVDVNQMLSRYLAMEDDDEILSVLKGDDKSNGGGGGGGGGGGERYERLPPEERAYLAFSMRLKRRPRQVARYAYGGAPLWSIPLPSNINDSNQRGGGKQQKSKKKSTDNIPFPTIPPCKCGAQRMFEFQLLPSVLHVLDVDSNASLRSTDDDVMDLVAAGGMNWGSIAVYSCPESCNDSREEFIIVQDSLDEGPVKLKSGVNGGGGEIYDDDIEDTDDN